MKPVTMLGAAAALIMFVMPAVTTAASADQAGKPWQTRICQYHVERGDFRNMGECLQRVRAGAEGYCSYLERIGYFDRPDARWRSKGQCKSWYRTRR